MLNRFKFALLLGIALMAAPLASMACCPSDGNGQPRAAASVGLGENYPIAENLATDTNWSAYEFERDGIRYVQINDDAGNVRAAVGNIAGTFWVLPIGSDADRVLGPGNSSTTVPVYSSGQRIYASGTLEVWRYQTASGPWWVVQPATR